jgi:hypothetical protein
LSRGFYLQICIFLHPKRHDRKSVVSPVRRIAATVVPAVLLSAAVAKISISLDDDLYTRVRDAAGSGGISGWLADAASLRLRSEALLQVADEIAESTGGAYSEAERAAAREWLP